MFKDQLPSACAGLVAVDYRLDSRLHCLVVTVDGLVRGYSVGQAHALFDSADALVDESQVCVCCLSVCVPVSVYAYVSVSVPVHVSAYMHARLCLRAHARPSFHCRFPVGQVEPGAAVAAAAAEELRGRC